MKSCNWLMDVDSFMRPSYRISPFTTSSISTKNACSESDNDTIHHWFDRYLNFPYRNWTLKGRDAITLAVENLSLNSEDTITILTSTSNQYVSSCVTNAIEKICRWNRTLSSESKAILVIHEFGLMHPEMLALYQIGLPIIEDFAHAFSAIPQHRIEADYVILSFAKFFAVQYGGMLLSKHSISTGNHLTESRIDYLSNTLSFHINHLDSYCSRRRENHLYLQHAFESLGCQSRFDWQPGDTPSVFMFTPPSNVDLIKLKPYMQKHGIESSIFYGENAFFIPVHQGLNTIDLDYFIFAYNSFCHQKNGH